MKHAATAALILGLGFAAPAWAGPKVYVPMGGADEVVVIDAAQDKVVDSIKSITESHGLAGSSDGRFLISGSLDEFDAAKTAPPKPEGMAQSEHESHHGGGAPSPAKQGSVSYLTLINAKTKVIERRIEVPGAVHHMLITPQDRFAVATHPNNGGVSVVDLQTYKVNDVATGPVPNYAAASPDGAYVYVSNAGNNTISQLDTKRWIVRKNIEVGDAPEHLVISADGKTMYVNNTGDGTVSVVSLPEGRVVNAYKVGGNIHGIDLSEDGKALFVARREDNKFTTIDLASGAVSNTPLGPSPYHLAAIKGTGKVYVSSAEEDKIWVVDGKTRRVLTEIPVPDRAHQMVVVQ